MPTPAGWGSPPGRPTTPFGPGGRPLAGARPYLAAALVAAAVTMVPIMLSDRAPSLLRWASRRIERTMPDWLRTRLDGNLPEPDIAIHLLVYGALGLLLGLLAWSWWSFVLGQAALLGGGVVLELSQSVLTSHRSVEVTDMVGNAVGQAAGIVAAVALLLAWRVLSAHRAPAPG